MQISFTLERKLVDGFKQPVAQMESFNNDDTTGYVGVRVNPENREDVETSVRLTVHGLGQREAFGSLEIREPHEGAVRIITADPAFLRRLSSQAGELAERLEYAQRGGE